MRAPANCAAALLCLSFVEVAIAQSESVLMLEQGDRKFQFDRPVNCIGQRRSSFGMRVLAERFLLVKVEAGRSDEYFVNSLQQTCPGLSGAYFIDGFADDQGAELRSEEVCVGDSYVRRIPGGGEQSAVSELNCELGLFWPLSQDIGAALAEGVPEMFDPVRPARFAVVSAEEYGVRPESISVEQAVVIAMPYRDEESESCVAECGVLDSLRVPGCLQQGRVRDQYFATLFELVSSLPRVRLPRDACGCLTFTLTEDGGISDVDVLFASSADVGERVARAFSELQPIGAMPAEASCLVGMTVPVPFYER